MIVSTSVCELEWMYTHMPVFMLLLEGFPLHHQFFLFKKIRGYTFQSYFNPLRSCRRKKNLLYSVLPHTGTVCVSRYVQYDTYSKSDLIGGASNRETNVKLQKQSSCQNWRFSFAFRPLFHYSTFGFCSILSFFLFWCVSLMKPFIEREREREEARNKNKT